VAEAEADREVAKYQIITQCAGFTEGVRGGHVGRQGRVVLGDPNRPDGIGVQALKDRVRCEQRGDLSRPVTVDRRLPLGEDRVQQVRLMGEVAARAGTRSIGSSRKPRRDEQTSDECRSSSMHNPASIAVRVIFCEHI
jgi:hypothetical protein